MRLHVVAVGRRLPGWVDEGFNEYNKRLPAGLQLHLINVTPVARSKNNTSKDIIRKEDRRIRAAIPEGTITVALDERGRQFDSGQLAHKISEWQQSGRNVTFVIGGADGLDNRFRNDADIIWSLSRLTLPHALIRVVLAEQIYRAWSITQSHPYHRE